MAIVDTTRAAFAEFLDLLYGRDTFLEQLALPRLLALSELEDRFLTHQRRVLDVVAERTWTPEDAMEVLDLEVSEEFAEAVGEATRGTLDSSAPLVAGGGKEGEGGAGLQRKVA